MKLSLTQAGAARDHGISSSFPGFGALNYAQVNMFGKSGAANTQALTGECSGDCTICGCSAESRANRTCCCSKKRQQQAHLHDDSDVDEPECCKKERAESKKISPM